MLQKADFKLSIAFLSLFLSLPFAASAQNAGPAPSEEFMRARVVAILEERTDPDPEGADRTVQTVMLRITTGLDRGKEFTVENGVLSDRADMRLSEGETVVVRKLAKSDGTTTYLIAEKYRLPAVLWLAFFFLVLAFLFGGWTGLRSLGGLFASILILTFYVVPRIAAGGNPLAISITGSFAIACTSIFLAHGIHRRTSVALLSTLATLALSIILALIFVHVAKLFGMGSEESMFLQIGPLQQVNLRGLLLGGIVIGCLGVLDDVTTAQTAAVDQIRKANPSVSRRMLLSSGFSVGKEHIASLINTLALAYAGASLPLLLLFTMQSDVPLWVTLNSEFLTEEIIRTLVGSIALLLAVPISTFFAVHFLHRS